VPTVLPRISVVIATCRRPEWALEAIRSVAENGYPDFEVVVVDQDTSSGLEGAIRSRFGADPRFVYMRLDRAILSRARNAGVARASGEIIHFVDDDALLHPGCLQAYAEAFGSRDAAPGIVAGRLVPRWAAPRPAWLPPDREYLLGIYDRGEGLAPMPGNDLPIGANFAVRRGVAAEVGPSTSAWGSATPGRPA
jgi:glycosyltransferase involved in cell wall biosynthesis